MAGIEQLSPDIYTYMFLNISFDFVHRCSIGRINSTEHLAGFAQINHNQPFYSFQALKRKSIASIVILIKSLISKVSYYSTYYTSVCVPITVYAIMVD